MRQGSGVVTSVAALSADSTLVIVEIDVHVPSAPRSLRYSVEVRVPEAHDDLPVAREAEHTGATVDWTVAWHRHEGVPLDIPITHLALATDASPRLVSLHLLEIPWQDPMAAVVDDANSVIEAQ